MKRTKKLIIALACCAVMLVGCSSGTEPTDEPSSTGFTSTIYDSTGAAYEQTFEQTPEKAVTIRTSAAEIMIKLGLEDKIVGICNPDNRVPEDLKATFDNFNNLGDRKSLSKEVIVAAEPDIVIGQAGQFTEEMSFDSFADLGIASYSLLTGNSKASSGPEALVDDIKNLGEIFGVQEAAEKYADEIETRLNNVKSQVATREGEKLRSIIMVNFKDGTFGVMNGTLQDEIMDMLGCEDVVEAGRNSLTYENLIRYNPDVIIYIMADRNAATDAVAIDTLLNEDIIKNVPAIANGKIIPVTYDSLMDVGPRMIDAIEDINTALGE